MTRLFFKSFYLFLLIPIFSSIKAAAQECHNIYYSYDNGGNRIKREYKCDQVVNPNQPEVISNPGGVITRIYPVPTPGLFHVEFSLPVSDAYLFLTNMSGIVLLERTITQPTTITDFDITSWIPGNYLLTSITGGVMESFTITKL